MKRLASLFFIVLVFAGAGNIRAQWRKVPTIDFTLGISGSGLGAMATSGHTVWAGVNQLWFSDDTGNTWLQSKAFQLTANSIIHDINFFDRATGIVATSDLGIMMTHDSGKTWKQVLLGDGTDFWKAS